MSFPRKTPKTTPATPSSPDKFTEERILGLLAEKHDDREWAFFSHLRNGTGLISDERTFDAYAINTWPSKKHLRIAYEVKISRSDFMREVNAPYKRASAMDASNQYYFVVPKGLVEVREVPENCGLIEANAGGLRTVVVARHREIKPPDLQFICSLLRASSLKPTGLKLFKYAGKELNQDELLELIEVKRDWATEQEIRKQVRLQVEEYKKSQPDHQLGEAVQKAMKNYVRPTPEAFEEWVRQIQTGIPVDSVKYLGHSAKGLAEDIQRFLERLDAHNRKSRQVPADDKPAGAPGDAPDQGADAPPHPPAAGGA
jgi:hypothetical protein